jgi:hypothetical protein
MIPNVRFFVKGKHKRDEKQPPPLMAEGCFFEII